MVWDLYKKQTSQPTIAEAMTMTVFSYYAKAGGFKVFVWLPSIFVSVGLVAGCHELCYCAYVYIWC